MHVDQRLLKACIAQNRTAQKELYDKLLPYLRAVAYRYLRDDSYVMDVLQESLVKLFQQLDNFDPKRAPLKNWAARVVINTCLNYNQRVIGKPTEELVIGFHEGSVSPEIFDRMSDDELMTILKKMPNGYFEVFNLFVIDGYDHLEISRMLNISVENSRKKLSRAKNWLRNPNNNIKVEALR